MNTNIKKVIDALTNSGSEDAMTAFFALMSEMKNGDMSPKHSDASVKYVICAELSIKDSDEKHYHPAIMHSIITDGMPNEMVAFDSIVEAQDMLEMMKESQHVAKTMPREILMQMSGGIEPNLSEKLYVIGIPLDSYSSLEEKLNSYISTIQNIVNETIEKLGVFMPKFDRDTAMRQYAASIISSAEVSGSAVHENGDIVDTAGVEYEKPEEEYDDCDDEYSDDEEYDEDDEEYDEDDEDDEESECSDDECDGNCEDCHRRHIPDNY